MSKRQAGIVVSGYDAKSQLVLWRTLESKLLAAEKKSIPNRVLDLEVLLYFNFGSLQCFLNMAETPY